MKALLLRSALFTFPQSRVQSYPILPRLNKRKSRGNVRAAMRQKRRLKNMNIYDPSFTKERVSSFHDIPDRFKVLLDFYEEIRNNSRLTRKPVPPADLKEYISRSKAHQEYNHFKFLKKQALENRSIKNVWNTLQHAVTLPPEPMLECYETPEDFLTQNYEYDLEFLYSEQVRNIQPLEPLLQDAMINDTTGTGKKRN